MTALIAFLTLMMTPEAPIAPRYSALTEDADIHGDEEPQYIDCIRLISEDVDAGRAAAQRWHLEGGGPAAQHCLAIADLAAGFPKLAAIRLSELADSLDAGDSEAKATIYAEAALAFLDADLGEGARSAIDTALEAAPGRGDLLIVAAKVYAAVERWQDAADAVTAAAEAGAVSAEAHIIRARALRALAKNDAAAEDVVAALRLDPFNLDALVLRGELVQAGIPINVNYRRAE